MSGLRFCWILRAVTGLLLAMLTTAEGATQEAPHSTSGCETERPGEPARSLSPEIDGLIRRYTSTVELRDGEHSAGKIRMVWLHPTLVDAIVNEYGTRNHLSPPEVARIKKSVDVKLQGPQYMPFLLLIQPESDARIGRPDWVSSGDRQQYYPSILLRGSAGHGIGPYVYYKSLGHGETERFFFTQPSHAYVIYRAQRDDGRPFIQKSDLSFVVDYQGSLVIGNKDYVLKAEFEYDLMPIPMHELIDANVTSWNQGWAELTRKPESTLVSRYRYPGTQQEVSSPVAERFYTQASATEMSRTEVLATLQLLIGFAQLVVTVAAL